VDSEGAIESELTPKKTEFFQFGEEVVEFCPRSATLVSGTVN
jgi:hypothetical protein